MEESIQEYEIKYINSEIQKISERKLKLYTMRDSFMIVNYISVIAMAVSSPLSSMQNSPVFCGSIASLIFGLIVMEYFSEEGKDCKKELEEMFLRQKVLTKK